MQNKLGHLVITIENLKTVPEDSYIGDILIDIIQTKNALSYISSEDVKHNTDEKSQFHNYSNTSVYPINITIYTSHIIIVHIFPKSWDTIMF